MQILEDLKKIKTEEHEAVQSSDNVPLSGAVKQKPGLDEGEHLYGNLSSSELSELGDSDFDVAPPTFGNAGARRDTAKTSVKSEYSSEDVVERQK